jgi:hypothetical protein
MWKNKAARFMKTQGESQKVEGISLLAKMQIRAAESRSTRAGTLRNLKAPDCPAKRQGPKKTSFCQNKARKELRTEDRALH